LAYSLIEFLRVERNRNYIKKCPICRDFTIVENTRRQVCYPPKDCEEIRDRRYQKDYMAKKRDPDSPEFDPDYVS